MQQEPHSEDWLQRRWPANSANRSRQLVRRFSSLCQQRLEGDCVGHAIRALTDVDPTATVLSTDGIGAYDHVLRSAMMSKLHDVPCFGGLLPFVRTTYAQPTEYLWEDAAGCDTS